MPPNPLFGLLLVLPVLGIFGGVLYALVRSAVRIAVRDAGPAPTVGSSDGFGLQIVDRLARATGVDRHESGKTFWAEVGSA